MTVLLYPLLLLNFWYKDSVVGILKFYKFLDFYFIQLLSLPVLVRTFFKPLKNEYRQGLVRFSIVMGVVLKTFLISLDILFLFSLIIVETIFFLGFLVLPIGLIYSLFFLS